MQRYFRRPYVSLCPVAKNRNCLSLSCKFGGIFCLHFLSYAWNSGQSFVVNKMTGEDALNLECKLISLFLFHINTCISLSNILKRKCAIHEVLNSRDVERGDMSMTSGDAASL